MNMPSLPTDNLYKFAALSGTVIVILSFYMQMEYIEKSNNKVETINTKNVTYKAEYDYAKERVKQLTLIVKNSIDNNNNKFKHDKNKMEIIYTVSELKEMDKEINLLTRSLDIKSAELEQLYKDHESAIKIFRSLKIKAGVIGFIGTIIAYIGYCLWYVRIQKYQDIAIKKEAFRE